MLHTYRTLIIRKEGTEMTQVDVGVWFWLLMLVMLIGVVLYWRQIHQKEQFQVVLLCGNSPKEVHIEAAGVWQAEQQAKAMMMKAGVRGYLVRRFEQGSWHAVADGEHPKIQLQQRWTKMMKDQWPLGT